MTDDNADPSDPEMLQLLADANRVRQRFIQIMETETGRLIWQALPAAIASFLASTAQDPHGACEALFGHARNYIQHAYDTGLLNTERLV